MRTIISYILALKTIRRVEIAEGYPGREEINEKSRTVFVNGKWYLQDYVRSIEVDGTLYINVYIL